MVFSLPMGASAQVQLLPAKEALAIFAGDGRRITVAFHNPGNEMARVELRIRLYQTSTATAVLLSETSWKPLQILPGQTVTETATLAFPAVRAETRCLVQWLDGTNTVLGNTQVRVFPTNQLVHLRTLAGETPVGLFDPNDQLKPLLRALEVPFQDLVEDGTDKFMGKLALFGPFPEKSQMRASLADDIRALAKRGVAVVWLQPPPSQRTPLKPSFYLVRQAGAAIVVAQASLVEGLAGNPEAQLNLLRLAELALKPIAFDLPETETSN